MGRESEAREAAERERARVAFSQSPQLYDRFGHPLMMGCELEFHDSLPPVYQIIDIKPDLRKDVPANAYLVTMRADLIVTAISRYPIDKATLVRMPVIGDAALSTGGGAGDAASGNQASEAEAPPQGSIVLTDMDRTARKTLSEVLPPPAAPLALVPPPPPPAPPAELPDPPPPPDPDEEIVF